MDEAGGGRSSVAWAGRLAKNRGMTKLQRVMVASALGLVKMKQLDAALAEEKQALAGETPPAETAEARVSPGVKMKQLDTAIAD